MKLSTAVGAIKNVARALSIRLDSSHSPIDILVELGLFIKTIVVSDQFVTLDSAVKAFLASKSDNALAIDAASRQFQKAVTDNGAISDEIALSFLRGLTDAASITDAFRQEFLKPRSDAVEFQDASVSSITKHVSDDVLFTDDVDGQASLEDDQEMHFFKSISNVSVVTEIFLMVMNYVRSADSSATVVDLISGLFGKVAQSNSSVSDAATASFSKGLTEVLSTVDGIAISIDTSRGDALSSSDAHAISISKLTENSASVVDEIFIVRGKNPFDDTFVSEIRVFSFDKLLGDLGSVSDLFERNAQFNRLLNELTLTSDTGSLRSQGYSDFTYFAEDYVGASRTF